MCDLCGKDTGGLMCNLSADASESDCSELLDCAKCGSTNIKVKVWINKNLIRYVMGWKRSITRWFGRWKTPPQCATCVRCFTTKVILQTVIMRSGGSVQCVATPKT